MLIITKYINKNCITGINRKFATQANLVPIAQNLPNPVSSSKSANDEYKIHPYDNSIEARKLRERQKWFDEIKELKTIEEKLIKINMPKYYGHKTFMLGEKYPYNCMNLTQHYTRSNFQEIENFQSLYKENDVVVNELCEKLKSAIIDDIEYSMEIFKTKYGNDENLSPTEKENRLSEIIINQLNRTLINNLSSEHSHLNEIEVDIEPRHEAFWTVGGIDPPKHTHKSREGRKWTKDKANDPIDRMIQYLGKPYMAIRHRQPLQSVKESSDANEPKEVPIFKYDARTIGYACSYRHGTNIPGFWPGSAEEFGLISYQKRDFMLIRNKVYGKEDEQEALHSLGMQSSFAWLFAQACYQGFSTFTDITYPLNTQTIVTDGKNWSFYNYQLNTTVMHSSFINDNSKTNNCWGTKELKLFEEFDENNKCIGFNDNVLKNLLHFYINKPKEREINMKPYLGSDVQKVSDIQHNQKREFLEKLFKHISSNRPKHLIVPEIYMWEKIYKIDNKTLQLASKRRFFELGINPFDRTLDQHTPEYVPKAIRPDGPKGKMKWKKTYYP